MNLKFSLWMAGKLIWGNRGRAMIPLFGVAAGISLVFVILSMGEGGRRSVRSDLSLLGENRIMVGPGDSRRARAFERSDASRIEGIPGVEYVHLTGGSAQGQTLRGNRVEVTGYGMKAMNAMESEILSGEGMPLTRGRILIDEETAVAEYGSRDAAGRGMEIQTGGRRREYIVQGVYRDYMAGVRSNGQVMAREDEVEEITGRVRSKEMIVAFYPEEDPEQSSGLILSMLDRAHGGRNLYRIMETNSRYERIRKIMGIINVSLGAMGAAALLLGGAGAANMTMLSVRERRGHIGILRAVGTTGRGVGSMFLTETLILTTMGGILGVPAGYILSRMAGQVTGVRPVYSLWQGLAALGLAVIMGAIAGYYPSMRAARMEPVEAIRG